MIARNVFFFIACFASVGLCVSHLQAENWPQWRGANHDGISSETNLPTEWTNTENVAWKLPLPGTAGSTPVVWGDHIFLTTADGADLLLMCVDTSGKKLWQHVLGSGDKKIRGDEGNLVSPSPVTDGKYVWAIMGTGDLGCFSFDGKEIWKKNLQKEYGKFQIAFGMTSTPVLYKDQLYLQLIHSGGAIVLALDKTTGKEIWQQKRPSDATDECEHSYASPTLYDDGKDAFLLTHGADYVIAHSLADGKELWRCGGLNPKDNYNRTLRFVASPVTVNGLIVVPSAKNGPVLGLKPNGNGDITKSEGNYFWKRERGTPDVPSPLVHDGLVYLCRESGVLICMDAKTGEEIYQESGHRHRHRASPVFADGKVYLTARDGVVTVVKAGRTFEVLATNKLGEEISASPVISNGTIYLRTFENLYAIKQK